MSEMFTGEIDTQERRSALTPLTEEPAPEMIPDWDNIGIFATGLALGVALGAAAALLVAPASGRELRSRVARKFGRGSRDESVWNDLAEELAKADRGLGKAEERADED